jgi:hypothetical protein
MSRFDRILLGSASAILLLIGRAGVESQAGEQKAPLYKTPQAVFDAAKKAAEKSDLKAIIQTHSDDNRDLAAGMMLILGAYGTQLGPAVAKTDEDKAKIKKIDAVLTRYGVTPEMAKHAIVLAKEMNGKQPSESLPPLRKLLEPVKDRAGLVADMMVLTDDKGGDPFDDLKTAKLQEVKVDGDVARGSVLVTKDGAEKTEPIVFRKEHGGWKIHIDMDKKK